MFCNTIIIKQTQQGYKQAVTNTINQEQSTGDCHTVQIEQQQFSQNKNIKILLEFPTVVNEKAEEEFKNFLKELYLRKYEIGSIQRELQALKSPPTERKISESSANFGTVIKNEEYENTTKEGKDYE